MDTPSDVTFGVTIRFWMLSASCSTKLQSGRICGKTGQREDGQSGACLCTSGKIRRDKLPAEGMRH